MRMAMHVGPEAGDAVQVAVTIGINEPASRPGSDHERLLVAPLYRLREGMPHVGSIRGHHGGPVTGGCGREKGGKVDRRSDRVGEPPDVSGVDDVRQHSQDGDIALRGDLLGVLLSDCRADSGGIREHHAEQPQSGVARRLDRERSVVDGAEIGACHDHHLSVE